MSYDLDLYFEPAVSRSRILQYFTTRKRYTVEKNNAVYQNPDTGVYFSMRLRCARSVLLQKNIVTAEFEINHHRPRFFGTEAEIELSPLSWHSSRGSMIRKCAAWAKGRIPARGF